MAVLIECVPNFSEGRDPLVIRKIAEAIQTVPNVFLLHIDKGEAANRTVFTFVGIPDAVVEAAFQAIRVASRHIDMRQQQGEHPRIGATDVCPLIPISGITLEEIIPYAHQLAQRVSELLAIPVYMYEAAATISARRNLATIRKGEYEGLAQKMQLPNWKPDYGSTFNPRTGATVIGARNFLIAYNINLDTKDAEVAKQIAAEVRESGKKVQEAGVWKRVAGSCKALKAIGWYIEEYEQAQVSMNIINFHITGMHTAFEACKAAATKYKLTVTGSELIGLVPLQALLEAGAFYAPNSNKEETELLEAAIKGLGLSDLSPFLPEERVVEYCLAK